MILIVDKTISLRAEALREKLFSLGCPCAVCVIKDIRRFPTAELVMTFTDNFDSIGGCADCHTVFIGKGFVNSALDATRADTADDAITEAHSYLMARLGIGEDRMYPFGIMLSPSLFVSDRFVEIYGNQIILTETESMIVKELVGTSDEKRQIAPEILARFCTRDGNADSTSVKVHISHINAKCERYFRAKLIRGTRKGYYITVNARNTRQFQNKT